MEEQNQTPEKTNKLPKWLTTVTPFSKALAMILFIAFPFLGFYLGMKYQEKLGITTAVITKVQQNKSLDIIQISPSALDSNTYTAISNGITIKIFPDHGVVGTKVKIDISGITDTNNLGVMFYDSQNDFSLQGLGITASEVHGGRYTGEYTIPLKQTSPPTQNQQNGGPEVSTAKGLGIFNVTHGSATEPLIFIPFLVDN